MADWHWPGARWWKCDLHVHTAESTCVDNTVSANDIIAGAVAAGLDVLAVTDHNSGRGHQAIVDAAESAGAQLIVLPGVELSVAGAHVLAVFPVGCTSESVTAYLGACGVKGAAIGQEEAHAACSILEAVQKTSGQAICIAAHADDTKGALKAVEGQDLKDLVLCDGLSAIEVKADDACLLAFADNSKSEYKRPTGALAQVRFSDAHVPSLIGSRATWLKMSSPSLEGLRLALQDGDLSVLVDLDGSRQPNRHASNVIESVTIADTKLMGRGTPLVIGLNPWFNAIIGGRGTGKSTFVEMLRIALDREDEVPDALRRDYDSMRSVPAGRSDRGLLRNETVVDVVYRKDDERYRVRWECATDTRTVSRADTNGQWQPTQGDIASRFPIRVFSQKQMFELARDPKALLGLVDDAVAERNEMLGFELLQADRRYRRASEAARIIGAELASEPTIRGALEDVLRRIRVFESAGHIEVTKEYARRSTQRTELNAFAEAVRELGEGLRQAVNDFAVPDADRTIFDDEAESDRSATALVDATRTALTRIATDMGDAATRAETAATAFEDDFAKSSFVEAADAAKLKFEELRERLKDEAEGELDDYEVLLARAAELQASLKEILDRKPDLAISAAALVEEAAKLQRERAAITQERASFLSDVLSGSLHISMTVVPYGAKEGVASGLRKVLRKDDSAFSRDIDAMVTEMYGNYPGAVSHVEVTDVSEFESRLASLKGLLKADMTGVGQKRQHQDSRFAAHLASLPPDAADDLDTWFPDDSLRVEYSPKGDGTGFAPLEQGSPGQKTAALLAFALSYGSQPIILDQPEDDLENRLIYELVVHGLRGIKQRRQVLVVTHNANVVVNGDAELVTLLDAPNGRTEIANQGSLQEEAIRESICEVLEGGREAFERRYRRIGAR